MQVSMYCDGGSRGNPGVAGSGSVVYDASGETLGEIAYVVGKKSTNNVAEYYGLVRGLEACREVGATHVDVFMDSKLVVEQMTGRWKIKHPDMQKLARQARDLASSFEKVTYTWVPRAKNKKADELSNVAMDAAARGDKPGIVKGTGVWVGEKPSHQTASPAHWAGSDAPRTRFILLRHGQTQHSAERRFSGTSDPELTDTGRDQARAGPPTRCANSGVSTPSSPLPKPARNKPPSTPPRRWGWTLRRIRGCVSSTSATSRDSPARRPWRATPRPLRPGSPRRTTRPRLASP